MNIYTKNGDRGTTSLMNGISVSKADDRIELVGTIDELNSFIGLAKVLADASLKESLAHIQRNLMLIMAGVADPRNMDYRFSQDETKALEEEIDRIENSFPRLSLNRMVLFWEPFSLVNSNASKGLYFVHCGVEEAR